MCVFVRQSARQCRQTSVSTDCRWDRVFTDTGSISYTCSSISSFFSAPIWSSSAGLYLDRLHGEARRCLICLISRCQNIDPSFLFQKEQFGSVAGKHTINSDQYFSLIIQSDFFPWHVPVLQCLQCTRNVLLSAFTVNRAYKGSYTNVSY